MGLNMPRRDKHLITSGKHALTIRDGAQRTPPPVRRANPFKEGNRIWTRGLYLGTNSDGQPVYLDPELLRTHLHLIGPTGQGKSRLLLWIFELLCNTNQPIVLIDPKGGLYRMARDWAMISGFQKRLVLFDLSGDVLPGYNPLRENGLRIDLQAQWVREGVKSAWGASTFDSTPLLARMLYLCLYSARALRVTLMDALDVLRPSPVLRQRALQQITDPFVHNALFAFDQLSDRIKAEQTSSTISRLEMFLCDQIVRKVVCSPRSMDLEQLLMDRKIILVNFGKYQPLLPDAVKLLGRMFFNDLLAHIYKGYGEGRFDEEHPVYIMCDEVQNFATTQVCDALDEGRGIGCHTILAHQHLHQLMKEDQDGYLYHSVMADARTKIVFGGLDAEDLKILAENLMLRHFDPWRIKYIQRSPSYRPVESTREVPTYNTSEAQSRSVTETCGEADTVSHSVQHSLTHGRSVADSVAFTEGEQESHTLGRNSSITESHYWGNSDTISGAHTTGQAASHGWSRGSSTSDGSTDSYGTNTVEGWSQGEGSNTATSIGEGQQMLPPGDGLIDGLLPENPTVMGISTNTTTTAGQSLSSGRHGMRGVSAGHANSHLRSASETEMDSTTVSSADTKGWSQSVQEGFGVAQQTGENEAWSRGKNWSTTHGNTITNSVAETDGATDTVGHTNSRSIGLTGGETTTHGKSVTVSPFYEYVPEVIETPTFLTPEEQRLLEMQKLSRPTKQHMVVIAPESPECVVRAPHVPDPFITQRRLDAGLESVYAEVPCYTHLAAHLHCTDSDSAHGADHVSNHDGGDVIDVEAEEVHTLDATQALPSPALIPVEAPKDAEKETEDEMWQRWHATSRGRSEKL